jgi:WD40 repeat protein
MKRVAPPTTTNDDDSDEKASKRLKLDSSLIHSLGESMLYLIRNQLPHIDSQFQNERAQLDQGRLQLEDERQQWLDKLKQLEQLEQVEQQIQQNQRLLEHDRVNLEQERQQLLKEKKEFEEGSQWLDRIAVQISTVKDFSKKKIVLDIGGTKFTTTVDTLTREKNTFFCGLFSVYGEWDPDEDGTYFIDRDGTHFRIILNHLRGMDVAHEIQQLSENELRQLYEDVKYYMIHSMEYYFALYNCKQSLLTGSSDGVIRLWNIKTGEEIWAVNGHKDPVKQLFSMPEKKQFLSCGSGDSIICLRDIKTGGIVRQFEEHTDPVSCIIRLSDGLIVSGSNGTVYVWSLSTFQSLNHLNTTTSGPISFMVRMSSDVLIRGSTSGDMIICNYRTRENRFVHGNGESMYSMIGVSDDTLWIADSKVSVWNITTGQIVHIMTDHTDRVSSLLQVSENVVASGSWDGTIKIWNVKTCQCVQTLSQGSEVQDLTKLSNNVIACCSSNFIKIWDVDKGQCLKTISTQDFNLTGFDRCGKEISSIQSV